MSPEESKILNAAIVKIVGELDADRIAAGIGQSYTPAHAFSVAMRLRDRGFPHIKSSQVRNRLGRLASDRDSPIVRYGGHNNSERTYRIRESL